MSDLIVGNKHYFWVYSKNICELSESPGVSKNTAQILKIGITFIVPEYKEHDFWTPFKFLMPLLDWLVMAGYVAALNCAFRGHPKLKAIWMKNMMRIGEDPKFLMTNYQGVLMLNTHHSSPFDLETYSCWAINELGKVLAECRLDIWVLQWSSVFHLPRYLAAKY